jgi:hypothetical protein
MSRGGGGQERAKCRANGSANNFVNVRLGNYKSFKHHVGQAAEEKASGRDMVVALTSKKWEPAKVGFSRIITTKAAA